ncbi:hypothetical protein cantadraft_45249 [Plakobranchus ocellatus]|uniref:Uncharacterized protein n=1 Tax=Plakobranchus ocellatus TaxID=259542 RepID=A0AAV4DL22_9GAST|nr:hypothetical protein cantadraft_45249 [Plakobranchus ocellatus]
MLKKYIPGDAVIDTLGNGFVSAASVAVVKDDDEGSSCDDCGCEVLPKFGGWGSKETAKELSMELRLEFEELAGSVFSILTDCPGSTIVEEHRIELTSSTPIFSILCNKTDVVRRGMEEMDNLRIIRKSNSPFASMVAVVKEKDGYKRVCIDNRYLNKLTVFDPHPMIRSADVFQIISRMFVFNNKLVYAFYN